jgi:lysophospholipase-3
MRSYLLSPLLLLLLLSASSSSSAAVFAPVIIVPGTAGSRLEAKLDKPASARWYCRKTTAGWYTLWLSVPSLLPPAINCWVDNIQLVYNPPNGTSNGTYANAPGVRTRTPGFGSTEAVEFLDPQFEHGDSDYFHDLVEALVAAGGVRNSSVRASPYDFRRAPTSAYRGAWLGMMTDLVEQTSRKNGGAKVVLLAHSMGNLYTLWFLGQKSPAWKRQYVKRWVATSGVFAGAGTGVVQLVSGSSQGVPGVTGMTVRHEQRSYESSMILLPTPQVWGEFPLVRVAAAAAASTSATAFAKNYSAHEYGELFAAAGDFPNFLARYNALANLTADLVDPGVPVTHLYGVGVDTPTAFEYDADSSASVAAAFRNGPTRVVHGDGDGTVPLRSLQSIEQRWAGVHTKTYANQTHTGVLKSKEYIADVVKLVLAAE